MTRTGRPKGSGAVEPIRRFLDKIEPTDTGCWLWTAATTRGYGAFWNGERQVYAHQFAHEFWIGPIPHGHEPDHTCRVPLCVNPDHLEAVTHRENVMRGEAWTAVNAHKTHCPQGHEYDYNHPDGSRRCKRCHAEQERRRRARRST